MKLWEKLLTGTIITVGCVLVGTAGDPGRLHPAFIGTCGFLLMVWGGILIQHGINRKASEPQLPSEEKKS